MAVDESIRADSEKVNSEKTEEGIENNFTTYYNVVDITASNAFEPVNQAALPKKLACMTKAD